MILLTSNGLSSKKLIDTVMPYVKENRKVALITTASVGHKEKDGHVPKLKEELGILGLKEIAYFDFDRDPLNKLANYRVIAIQGGNPFYLLRAIKSRKGEKALHKASEEGVLIGISGGALVLQQSLTLIEKIMPMLNQKTKLQDLIALQLSPVDIIPHYSKFLSRDQQLDEKIREYEKNTGISVYPLEDGQGVLIEAEKIIKIE